MARNTSFTLSDHFVDFINEQVASAVTAPPAKSSAKVFA
jgi:hypothetical protein